MKKTFLLLPLALTLIIGTGSSVFVFSSGNSSIEDNNVNVKFDDIRDNYELGEEGDPDTYIKKFNVYFFSQSDFTPGRNEANNGPANIYYMENTDTINYGSFDDGSYYKVIKDVSVLYASDVLSIGEPTTTLNDEKGYNVVFNGWALTGNIGNYTGLNNNAVTGNFPYNGSSPVNLMTYGSSIELFINRFKDSEGNNLYGTDVNSDDNNYDLYLYPIYTTGKCYVNASYKNNPLRVEYFSYEDENNTDVDGDGNSDYLSYDECFMNEGASLNSSLDAKFDTDITCYFLSPLNLDNISHLQFKYSVYNSSSWLGSWSNWNSITYGENNTNLINFNDDMLSRLTSNGIGNGKYSVFSFVKVTTTNDSSETEANLNAAKFTNEEKAYIEDLLENEPYVCLSGNAFSIGFNNFFNKARYYVNIYFYFTRLYEPRLIGGPTNSLSYESEHDKQYNFVLDSNYSNVYSIDNVKFDPDNNYMSYDENCSVSKAVFGIELDSTSNFDLDYKVGDYNSDPLEGRYSLYNNFNYLSKMNEISSITDDIAIGSSFDELRSNKHLFVINKSDISSHNVGYGTYSLAIKIEYETEVINGYTVRTPSEINVYVYRQHDAFIAIYGEETITSSARNSNIFIEPDLDSYTKIDFIALYVYRNAPLEYDEEMYFDVNGLIEVADEESGTNGYVTLREIVAYYNNKGYELYDRLTGFVINDESMSSLTFKTTKNLVFQIRERKIS
ncbi:MAG: hypothetical protein ACI311_00785 [Bacilli bacterium]